MIPVACPSIFVGQQCVGKSEECSDAICAVAASSCLARGSSTKTDRVKFDVDSSMGGGQVYPRREEVEEEVQLLTFS